MQHMQPIRTIWTILVGDHPGTIPVEFGQIKRRCRLIFSLYNSMWNCDPRAGVNFDPRVIIWTTLVEDP